MARTGGLKSIILIQAHKDVALLNRLIDRLSCDMLSIYVHLDLKSPIDPRDIDPRARQIRRRVRVFWNSISQVEATLSSFDEILEAEPAFTHIVFISGQDYPVRSNQEISDFLHQHRDRDFLAHGLVTDQNPEFLNRYTFYHPDFADLCWRRPYKWLRSTMKLTGWRRKMVNGWHPYGGDAWFMLTRPCVEFIQRNSTGSVFHRFMRTVSIPDELYFQTLLCNSPLASRLVNKHHRFVEFAQGAANPRILQEADYERIVASEALFCRKIDRESAGLLDRLDQHQRAKAEAALG